MAKYPKDLIVRQLRPDEWHLVAERFENGTGGTMPTDVNQSIFYGIFLGAELIGFGHLEKLFHLNAVFVNKEHRNGVFADAVIETMNDEIPAGYSVVIHPRRRWQRLLSRFGFYDTGTVPVWRKDY